jgi:hypothetical protein
MPDRRFMVFDVESVGLHGEGFAVGYVVIDHTGNELDSGRFACPPDRASGSLKGREWVAVNVPALPVTHATPSAVRSAFWHKWQEWQAKGAMLVADCAWPVETGFLSLCIKDVQPVVRGCPLDDGPRGWEGPYPLLDAASMFFLAGIDPLASHGRLENEIPEHDPLADARQTARLMLTTRMPA